MAYLVTFHWGWLLASLLLGLAMGWIAVVHRGDGVSKTMSRWLAAAGRGAGRRRARPVVPGRFGYWLDLADRCSPAIWWAAPSALAARLGGFAQRARRPRRR